MPIINKGSGELERLTLDCVEFQTRSFLYFLRKLMGWSGDRHLYYIVLDPSQSLLFCSFQQISDARIYFALSSEGGDVRVHRLAERAQVVAAFQTRNHAPAAAR